MKVESEMLMRTVKIRPTRPKPRTLHISHPHHSASTHGCILRCKILEDLFSVCSIPTNNSRVQSAPQSILVSEWCLVTHERKFERFRQRRPAHLNDQDRNRRYTRFVVGGRDSYIRGFYDGLWSSKTMWWLAGGSALFQRCLSGPTSPSVSIQGLKGPLWPINTS